MIKPYSQNPETVRKREWLRNKPPEYRAARNANAKAYQSTFRGWLTLKAGSLNTGVAKRGYRCRGKLTGEDLHAVWARSGGSKDFEARCAWCGGLLFGKGEIVFDHVRPLYFGGMNTPDNLQILCNSCHLKKTGKEVKAKSVLEPWEWGITKRLAFEVQFDGANR